MASLDCLENSSGIPSTSDYLAGISERPVNLTLLIACTLVTVLLVAFLIESACFLSNKVQLSAVSNHRITTWWMIAVLPVMSCVVLPGVYSPVSATFCNLVASLCYSFTMFKFLVIVMNYYGGYEKMMYRFSAERFTFPLASTPLTCCCLFLPEKRLTRRSFKWLKIAVLQVAIFKPVTSFIGVIIWLDAVYLTDKMASDRPLAIVNTTTIFSSVIAMMALNMIYIASTRFLQPFHVRTKFTFIKLGIVICNIQPALLSLIMRFRLLECTFPFSNQARANFMQCILFILEAGILFPFILYYYRRSEGNVVGNVSSAPFINIISIRPIGITPRPPDRQLIPRPSITSIDVGRARAQTVIGSGDMDIDFCQPPELSTIDEEPGQAETMFDQFSTNFERQFTTSTRHGRRHTIS
ncbi:organic solute transporter subunit alpha-like [Lytechinus variegatus]|uniref:organic solute transporter subunit alpha-like n=1 Tax=Lytechinus variegatus TaxID=7654 RepID=UPI001BB0DC61|nr:organic solute transporter subunit alpha-like [Lytechinus variegatus]